MSTHTCPAPGCRRLVADRFLMCGPHWRQVPIHIQREVYRTNAMRPLPGSLAPYQAAVKAAIAAVSPSGGLA